ncbi:MAG TPA: endonuclease/exonuclease/phosphatase family protein [Arachidicoccus sp.]|nr:endonuclease/exonuclease/phosphatase family protein [Arachidicoccus sp.]
MGKFLMLFVFLMGGLMDQSSAQKIITGTYNLRYDNPGDSINAWEGRRDKVATLIKFYDFDCFGTQEGLHHQLEQLHSALSEYDYVGVGRSDGKTSGEYAAIFYKKAKFKPIKSGTFWLSGTDLHHPNKGWDAALPRICTWVALKDKKTGKVFYHFNTHFDHRGIVARAESAKLILKMIQEIAKTNPVILTGDFNVDQNSDSYKLIHQSPKLEDAFEVAPIKMAFNGTFNAFNPNGFTKSRIDHVFISKNFKALRYGVLTASYRKALPEIAEKADSRNFPGQVHLYQSKALLPSDHFPVLVQLEFKDKKSRGRH